jgi:sulfoxide reductase catalytic subunit YedY
MLIKSVASGDCKEFEVTDERAYLNRREIIKKMGFVGVGSLLASSAATAGISDLFSGSTAPAVFQQRALQFGAAKKFSETLTPEVKVTGHNNFYEFGIEKQQPAELSQGFKVDPWQLKISGEVENPLTLGYDDLYSSFPLEERIYRLRCVEAWSMVVPWIGSMTQLRCQGKKADVWAEESTIPMSKDCALTRQ